MSRKDPKDPFEKLETGSVGPSAPSSSGRREFLQKLLAGAAFAVPVMMSFSTRRASAQTGAAPTPTGTVQPITSTAPQPVVSNQLLTSNQVVFSNQVAYCNRVTFFDATSTNAVGTHTQIVYVPYAADVKSSSPIPFHQAGVVVAGRPLFFNQVRMKNDAGTALPASPAVFVELSAKQLSTGYNSKLGRPYFANQVYLSKTRIR